MLNRDYSVVKNKCVYNFTSQIYTQKIKIIMVPLTSHHSTVSNVPPHHIMKMATPLIPRRAQNKGTIGTWIKFTLPDKLNKKRNVDAVMSTTKQRNCKKNNNNKKERKKNVNYLLRVHLSEFHIGECIIYLTFYLLEQISTF